MYELEYYRSISVSNVIPIHRSAMNFSSKTYSVRKLCIPRPSCPTWKRAWYGMSWRHYHTTTPRSPVQQSVNIGWRWRCQLLLLRVSVWWYTFLKVGFTKNFKFACDFSIQVYSRNPKAYLSFRLWNLLSSNSPYSHIQRRPRHHLRLRVQH